MGFGKGTKKSKKDRTDEKPKDEKGFVPSTDEELKKYRKAGKKTERLRSEAKQGKKGRKRATTALRGEDLRQALFKEELVHVFSRNLFDAFVELCKLREKKPPAYREFLDQKEADGTFLYEIISILSSCSWTDLGSLTFKGLSADESPLGLATKSWTEAFHFARHVMLLALKAVEKKGTLRLTDRSVLDDWPVESRKRPSKEDRKMKLKGSGDEELDEKRLAALAAAAGDDDEDEDDDEDDEAEDDADDEDEDDDDGDDDEDEDKPAKKGKKSKAKAKKGKKSKDEDDEDDDDDDEDGDDGEEDDDADDDDEEPKKGKKSKAKGKAVAKKGKGKKSKAKDDDEDGDEDDDAEDDEDDEDDPEDSDPKAKKGKGFAKGKKSSKGKAEDDEVKSKKGKKADKAEKKGKDKPAKKAKSGDSITRVSFNPKTKLKLLKPYKGSNDEGEKEVSALFTKGTNNGKDLFKKGEDAELSKTTVIRAVKSLVRGGFAEITE